MNTLTPARDFLSKRLPSGVKRQLVQTVGAYRKWAAFRNADVLLVSFPKSGRTWLRVLIGRCTTAHFGLDWRQMLDLGRLAAADPRVPKVIPTHDVAQVYMKQVSELPRSKRRYRGRDVILLVRDPRDVIVSAYFQATRRKKVFRGTLKEFLPQVDALVAYLNGWSRHRNIPRRFLLVRYEDLKRDTAGELKRVLTFISLGELGDDVIEEAVEFASFENMRRLEQQQMLGGNGVLRPKDPSDQESFKTRRGIVGGFREYCDDADVAFLNSRISALDPYFGY